MITRFAISNDKLILNPTIYRQVTLRIEPNYDSSNGLILVDVVCKMEHYLDENKTEKAEVFADKIIVLRIDNETIVDNRTGNYANANTPVEYQAGELDFFMNQKLGSINEMLAFGVQRADLSGRFD